MKYPVVRQLSAARKSKGLSLEEMANRVGYEYETMAKIEYGARQPSIGKLMRWADALDFDISITPKVAS